MKYNTKYNNTHIGLLSETFSDIINIVQFDLLLCASHVIFFVTIN